jgi:hypothetical protein
MLFALKCMISDQLADSNSSHENMSSVRLVVPCGRTDGRTDRQMNKTKLIVDFRNFVQAPKKQLDRH